ncbi:hypothetical protein NUH87_25700 [Pseudomonas batumici]|uniref:hypothetical protein n=1 Tax=Pseudomonas batumici TaxID=226910 RepID=UPI0030CA792F
MSNYSVTDIVNWLKTKGLSGWDAIAAYDQAQVNAQLAQEYIARFNSAAYLPLVNEDIPTEDGVDELVIGYELDAPRLSFENSSIKSGVAKMTLKVVGGTQLSMYQPPGGKRYVNKVEVNDALDGQQLTMDVELAVMPGTVDSAGSVVVDMAKGTNFELSFSASPQARKLAGATFQKLFDEVLKPEQKLYVLNTFSTAGNPLLKVKSFGIRAHAAPGASRHGADNFGDGEVVFFITLMGGEAGRFPSSENDFQYLIPAGDYSSTFLVSRQALTERVFLAAVRRLAGLSDTATLPFELTVANNRLQRMDARGGELRPYENLVFTGSGERFVLGRVRFLLYSVANPEYASSLEVRFEGDKALVTWKLASQVFSSEHFYTYNGVAMRAKELKYVKGEMLFDCQYSVQADKTIALKMQVNDLDLVLRTTGTPQVGPVSHPSEVTADAPPAAEIMHALENQALDFFNEEMRKAAARFASTGEEVSVLALGSLLFRQGRLELSALHVPGDMAIFGKIASGANNFVVTPLEPVVGHGAEQRFATVPARSGLRWSVEGLDGNPNIGRIDPTTGVYTAPAASVIAGSYVRVRVKAATADGAIFSYALVTVVVRDITVNPVVQTATAGNSTPLALSAGSSGRGELIWRMADLSSGATLSGTSPKDMQYVPGPKVTGQYFKLDEVLVTEKNSSTGNSQSSFVLVAHRASNIFPEVDDSLDLPQDQVQIVARGEDEQPIEGITWTLLAGSGRLSESGRFSVDPAGHHKFAVITAFKTASPLNLSGFIILPLPLLSSRRYLDSLGI